MAEEKKSSNKTLIIVLIIVIILLLAGGITAFVLMKADKPDDGQGKLTPGGQIPMEITAGVLDPDTLEKWNEEALKEAKDNQIPISYSPTANSVDGKNFACVIGNPEGAPHYFYVDMYSDTTLEEEIYLSGLIEPGRGLTSFTTNKTFPQGETDIVLVITTVEDDMKTIIAQTMVYLTLVVSGE